eukprot:gene26674-34952_t
MSYLNARAVTYIGSGAFKSNTAMSNLTLSTSVVVIMDSAFASCSRQEKLLIKTAVTSTGKDASKYNLALDNLTLSTSMEILMEKALSYSSDLWSLFIPTSVTYMGPDVFNCKKSHLTYVAI